MLTLLTAVLLAADPKLAIPQPLRLDVMLPTSSLPELSTETEGTGPSFDDLRQQASFPVDGDEWLADPFSVLGSEMNSSASDLKDGAVVRSTRQTQPRILSRLDRLVLLLEKQCKSGGGPAGNRATKPAGDGNLAAGPGGGGELQNADGPARGMDRLSDAERSRILQTQTEGFPPGFDDVLSDYYRRLAVEDSTTLSDEAVKLETAQ